MAREETEAILESVGLLDKKDMKGGLLAHGDQKRLEIGIALAVHPSLLLLDEPTQGMSPKETAQTTELIQKLVKQRGPDPDLCGTRHERGLRHFRPHQSHAPGQDHFQRQAGGSKKQR